MGFVNELQWNKLCFLQSGKGLYYAITTAKYIQDTLNKQDKY